MLKMKLRDTVAGSLFGCSIEEDSHICLGTGQASVLLMIAPELEELASSALAIETAAAKGRQNLREERTGAPHASGKKK